MYKELECRKKSDTLRRRSKKLSSVVKSGCCSCRAAIFSAPMFSVTFISSSRGSQGLSWPPQAPTHNSQHIHTHKPRNKPLKISWRKGGCQQEQTSWDPISLIKSKYIPAYILYFYLHVTMKVLEENYLCYSGAGIQNSKKSSIK